MLNRDICQRGQILADHVICGVLTGGTDYPGRVPSRKQPGTDFHSSGRTLIKPCYVSNDSKIHANLGFASESSVFYRKNPKTSFQGRGSAFQWGTISH